MRYFAVRLAAAFALTALGACIEIRARLGNRPAEQLLEQKLVMRQSTMDDVRALLGAPFGTGSAMLPIQARPGTMWSYYYEEGTMLDDRRMFLFVYFAPDDLYEGYLWFSSLPGAAPSTAGSTLFGGSKGF